MSFKPIRNDKFDRGVDLSKEEFKIDNNAFADLTNCYQWRDRILRRRGNRLLGRLRRCITAKALAASGGGTTYSGNIITFAPALEATASLQVSSITITVGGKITVTDDGAGGFTQTGGTATLDSDNSSINYATGAFTIELSAGVYAAEAVTTDFCYFPNLPVMGIRTYEVSTINEEETIFFDTTYAYTFNSGTGFFDELVPGTTWTGNNSDFFYSTNYYQDAGNRDLFWATNFSSNDPIRYYNGISWTNFNPDIDDAGTNQLYKALLLVPFRGLLLAMNTFEGTSLGASIQYPQRVRGSQIGDPLDADAWKDDIPGRGFFFDLPTNEHIRSFGFVRDSLVVFTERSSWLLSWTGDSVVPVIDQRENTDLGIESTFSVLNFDDKVAGIGDKFIIASDSINAYPINNDIPDFAFTIHNDNDGRRRVHGVRDYNNRLALWTYPRFDENGTYPNRVLVWNYIDNTWQFFRDNLTCFGTFQPASDLTWENVTWTWAEWTQTWGEGSNQSKYPDIVAGNQQGFIMNVGKQTLDDASMYISAINIVGGQVQLEILNHNLEDGEFINVTRTIGDYTALNGNTYKIGYVDSDNVSLFNQDSEGNFDPLEISSGTYLGGGQAAIIPNFRILSKKFNMIEDGKKVLLGYIDLLLESDPDAIFNLNLYLDYKSDSLARSNFWSTNIQPDESIIDTPDQTKIFRKFWVGQIGNFVQFEITINDQNMPLQPPGMYFQLDSVVLYVRPSGRLAD